jgi:hypothetical protein
MTRPKQICWARQRIFPSAGVCKNLPLCGTPRDVVLTRDRARVTCPKCLIHLTGVTP